MRRAAVINAGWCAFLIGWGRKQRSPALVADGWHLLTDVATSVGVLAGLGLAALTGWHVLDPALAAARRTQHSVGRLAPGAGLGGRPDGRGGHGRGRPTHPRGDRRRTRRAPSRPTTCARASPAASRSSSSIWSCPGEHDGRRLARDLRSPRGGASKRPYPAREVLIHVEPESEAKRQAARPSNAKYFALRKPFVLQKCGRFAAAPWKT